MADSKLLKAVKTTIHDFETIQPLEMIGRLRDGETIKKMKKHGVNEAQLHRMILILQEHKPNAKEFVAYLKSNLV